MNAITEAYRMMTESYTGGWDHSDAMKYADKLVTQLGKPKIVANDMLAWNSFDGFTKVWILDESIIHNFPMAHKDFVYSTRNIKVSPEIVGKLAYVTASIIVDGLKGEVTARCGMLIKNAVTLGYVEDVVAGRIKGDLKAEYSRRIKGDIIPSWYKDSLGEKSE